MRERFMPSEREKGITQPFIVYCTATTPLLVDCCDIPYMKYLPLCSFSHNLSTFVRSFTNPFLFFHSTLVLTSLCPFSLPLPLFPFLTPVHHPTLPSLPPSLSLSPPSLPLSLTPSLPPSLPPSPPSLPPLPPSLSLSLPSLSLSLSLS